MNGQLDDEGDDIIDDSVMYFTFVRLAAQCGDAWPPQGLEKAMDEALTGYAEPCPGAKRRVEQALEVMLTAWFSSQLQKRTAEQLAKLGL